MKLARGTIVAGCIGGEHGAAVRPFLVVQSDIFDEHATVSLCPLTSILSDTHLFRVPLEASVETGLDRDSEIQVDKVQALDRDVVAAVLGRIPITTMTKVDDALRRWLEL